MLIKHYALLKRILSALVLAPIAIFCLFYGSFAFMAMALGAALITCYEWYNMVKSRQTAARLMFVGTIYITISYFSFIFLRFGFDQGAWITLVVMGCVWGSDITAYLLGKSFKGPKLCPAISPNKTWSGLIGALLGVVIVLAPAFIFLPLGLRPVPLYVLFMIAPVIGLAAQGGDLMISALKRKAGLKDTGNLIPGHGGLLDRIDALMLVTPLSLLLLLVLQG